MKHSAVPAQQIGRASPDVSIVIPVYNSEDAVEKLVSRIREVIQERSERFECILVDDGSQDESWSRLKVLRETHSSWLRIVRLHRNSGQHNALLCGFTLSHGAVVVTMDDDLQNPPEEIGKLLDELNKGVELVVGATSTKQESSWRKASGGMVDWVIRKVYQLPSGFQLTSFRAIKRSLVDRVIQMAPIYPYITAMLLAQTSSYSNCEVKHAPREPGSSRYSFLRSLSLAANLLLNYSSLPVILVGLLSFGAALIAFVLGAFVFTRTVVFGNSVPGWTSMIVVLSFSSAVTLFCMFIFSLYFHRLNQQLTRSRVSFSIAERYDT